jgi:hypothetical protein
MLPYVLHASTLPLGVAIALQRSLLNALERVMAEGNSGFAGRDKSLISANVNSGLMAANTEAAILPNGGFQLPALPSFEVMQATS